MKEKELINIIKSIVGSEYIGDDCAYLKDMGLVISQDSLVEDVHFSLKYFTPYQLGWKSVMVNISDICASGAEPRYLTIALSLPKYIDDNFVREYYKGAKDAAGDVKIVGGDLTGSEKLFISISVLGSDFGRKISSRKNAKCGYKIIVSGEHGNSAKGFKQLSQGVLEENIYTKAHLMPEAQILFSKEVSQNVTCDYAMMDTSDGLADALFQIAKASNVNIKINTLDIPHDEKVPMDFVLYGGEDYQLVAAVPSEVLQKLSNYKVIGEVCTGKVGLEIDGKFVKDVENKIYNHFK